MSISRKEPDSLDESKWLETDQYFEANNVVNITDEGEHLELSGAALEFDGNDYVSIPHSSSLNISGNITLSAWVKFNAVSSYDTIIGKRNSTTRTYALQRNSESNKYAFSLNNVGWVQSTTTITTGVWRHIVGTYNGSAIKIYIDGVEENSDTVSGSISTNTSAVNLGREGDIGYYRLNGQIAEARIYSRALSASEVEDLYNGKTVSDTNLEGWWKLDEGTGTTAGDSSGNSNNGTISGATWVSSYTDNPWGGTGYRVSNPLALSGTAKSSNIKWTSTEPTDTDIKIYTAISDSNTVEPSEIDYSEATNDASIPDISGDLTGKYLWIRQELSTEDADATPRLSTLEVLIETAKKSLAFFKFF